MNLLQAKTAFVTGATSGIGRANALLLAAEGASVGALDRAPEVEAPVKAIRAAGGRAIALVKDSSVEEHVASAIAAAVAALTMTRQRRGSIICTASVAGLRSGAGCMPYSASKSGVISLVQTAANELAGTGVRINAICPGLVETGMTRPISNRHARAAPSAGSVSSIPCAARARPARLRRWLCFSRPMPHRMST